MKKAIVIVLGILLGIAQELIFLYPINKFVHGNMSILLFILVIALIIETVLLRKKYPSFVGGIFIGTILGPIIFMGLVILSIKSGNAF